MAIKSIQQYLRTRILWGSSAILVVGTIVLGFAIRSLDVREFDAALETKARTLATLVLREDQAIEVDLTGELMPEFEPGEEVEYYQLRLANGALIGRSDLLGESDLPFIPHANEGPAFLNLRLPDGRRGRLVQISFLFRPNGSEEALPEAPHPISIVLGVARSREGLDALLWTVYLTFTGADVLVVGLIALLIRRSVNKGFQPVAELNAQIAALDPNTLNKRIDLMDLPAEIKTIPIALNRFIEALEAAFARERRFTGDVAHELRTPIAEFRAACEVGAEWSDDPKLVRRRFENLRESAAHMERLLNSLIDLSRIEKGTVDIRVTATPIASLIDSCWSRLCREGVESGPWLENLVDQSLILNTDAIKLEMIFFNLLNNAAHYSLAGAAVTCMSQRSPLGGWAVCISNPPRELVKEDLTHLFERFWRKDAARTGGRHLGLGLSITKVLSDALGIRITVDLNPGNVFTVCLLFPSQDSADFQG